MALVQGKYNSVAPTLQSGQMTDLQLDVNGNLKTSGGGGGGAGDASAANQATQITAEQAILAKIIAAPATEAKQDSIITLLTTQSSYLDGVETALTAANASLDDIETAVESTAPIDVNIISGQTGITAGAGAVAANTPRVTLSNDGPFATLTGAVTETAPASDTASSGLNGRLQRIAQRITSLIALIPAALGVGTISQSFRVGLPSDQFGVAGDTAYSGASATEMAMLRAVADAAISTSPANVVGPAAHDAAISGAPVRIGGRAVTANPAAVATGDTADILTTLVGAVVTKPYSIPDVDWSYAAPSGGKTATGGVTIKAAAAAGLRNYITSVQLGNSGAAGTDVQIKDGAAGTVIWRGYIAAAVSGHTINFVSPLKSTAATLLEIDLSSGTTVAVYFNAQGYVAP